MADTKYYIAINNAIERVFAKSMSSTAFAADEIASCRCGEIEADSGATMRSPTASLTSLYAIGIEMGSGVCSPADSISTQAA